MRCGKSWVSFKAVQGMNPGGGGNCDRWCYFFVSDNHGVGIKFHHSVCPGDIMD